MKKYIEFYGTLPVRIDREELHRQIRLALNEQNLPKEVKTLYLMVEDMYCITKMNSILGNELLEMGKKAGIVGTKKDGWVNTMELSDQMLERWETALLKMQ